MSVDEKIRELDKKVVKIETSEPVKVTDSVGTAADRQSIRHLAKQIRNTLDEVTLPAESD